MKSKTKKLTVASMTCALSVVLMLLGSIFEVMDLSCAAICSALIAFSILELGGAYPVLVYCATTLLGILLLPNKLPALYYALFFGWYPIAKLPLERLRGAVSLILKLMLCAISLTAILLASTLFAPAEELICMSIPVYVLCLAVFLIYDVALSRITVAYLVRYRHKIKLWRK